MPRRKKKSTEEANEKAENVENSEVNIDEIIDEAEKIEKELEEKSEKESEAETIDEEKKYEKGYCKKHGFVTPIIKGNKPACPYCHRYVIIDPEKIDEILSEDKEEDISENEENDEIPELPEIKPPDVEFVENCINFLKKNLPNVYGIESKKRAEAIIQTIEQNPNILYNPVALYIHIKNLAPRVNDYHLCWVLNAMYSQVGGFSQQPFLQLLNMQNYVPPALLSLLNIPFTQQQFNIPIWFMHMQPMQQVPLHNTYTHLTIPMQQPLQTSQNENQKEKKSKKIYKVVTDDGTVIETDDPEEYRALVDWVERRKREREEWELRKQEWEEKRRREEREWELRMKKLEEELKNKKEEASTEKRKEGESELVKMLLTRIDALNRELNEAKQKYEELKEQIKESERKAMEERIKMLEDELRVLREYASDPFKIVEQYENIARRLGYSKTGKNVLDILDKGIEGVHQTVNNLISKLTPAPRRTEVKYTEQERKEKLKQIKQNIQSSEDLLKIEDEVIKAAEKIYTSNSQTTEQK